MSERRRPSPLQPPLSNELNGEMGKPQHTPTLPTPTFLARPDSRLMHDNTLPGIRTLKLNALDRPPLSPLQLPPPVSRRTIGITDLLSDQPTPHATRHAEPVPHPPGPDDFSPQSYTSHVRPSPSRAELPSTSPYLVASSGTQNAQHQPRGSYSSSAHSTSPSLYGSSDVSPRTSAPPRAVIPRISQPPPLRYELIIRQQPSAARACGYGERDRRVIDPPPILELKITDPATEQPAQDNNAMLAMHCTLMTPDGERDDTEVQPASSDSQATRRLMGTLVASPYQAKDEHGVAGTFFVFPDLSCRSPGRYTLRFNLLRIDPMAMAPGVSSPRVAYATSDVFSVYTAKDFPGMRASSALLKALRRQGLNVGVKKGSEARKGKAKATSKENAESDESSSDSSEDGDVSPRSRPKKTKRQRVEQ